MSNRCDRRRVREDIIVPTGGAQSPVALTRLQRQVFSGKQTRQDDWLTGRCIHVKRSGNRRRLASCRLGAALPPCTVTTVGKRKHEPRQTMSLQRQKD